MKTTPKHFEAFKKYVWEWLGKMKVSGWDIYFDHLDLNNAYARTYYDHIGRVAIFKFCKEWDDRPLNMKEISETAKHEVVELLIADYHSLALSRFVSEDALQIAREALVVTLTELL